MDELAQAYLYAGMHPGFAPAFAFLRRADLAELPVDRYEIDGEQVYAMVSRLSTRGREGTELEAHRRYIDMHYLIAGREELGWKSTPTCTDRRGEFNEDNDVEMFGDAPDTWFALNPGQLAIFYPADAHIPLVGAGELHKVVVKVAV